MTTNEPELPPRPDPEADTKRALKQAGRKATAARNAIAARNAAMWFAHEAGASFRDIEDATGIPYKTVDRIVKRVDEDEPDEG